MYTEFDHTKDYYRELGDDEKFDGKYPLLKGLTRLAFERGVAAIHSDVISTPSKDAPIVVVTSTVTFKDGCTYSASADATSKSYGAPYNKHLTACADSASFARALRRAFNISVASKEECSIDVAGGDVDNVPITEQQIVGINMLMERNNLPINQALKLIKVEEGTLPDLTRKQGRDLMKALNKYKPKNVKEKS